MDDREEAVDRLEGSMAHRFLEGLGPISRGAAGPAVRLPRGLACGDVREHRREQPAVGETENCDVDSTGSSNRRSS